MKSTNIFQVTFIFLFSFFLALSVTNAQDKPKKENKKECIEECSKACCESSDKSQSSNLECGPDCDNKEYNHEKMMKEKNHSGHSMKSDMKGMTSISDGKIFNKYCPVKGGEVDPEAPTVEYNGKIYGFCCPGCDDKFKAEPEKYSENISEDGQEFIEKT